MKSRQVVTGTASFLDDRVPSDLSDILIREASQGDARSIAEVHVRAWRWAYRDEKEALDGPTLEDRMAQWTPRVSHPSSESAVLVAESNGRVVGFAFVGPSEDEDARDGTTELISLYVDEHVAGTGVGRGLMKATMELVRGRGYSVLTLWAGKRNHRARRFYEAAGLQPDGAAKSEIHSLFPLKMDLVRYRCSLE